MKFGLHWIAGCTLALGLLGCHAPSNNGTASMELKIYPVPSGQSTRLSEDLRIALVDKAQVAAPTPDKLLVYAAHDTQASIGSVIAELTKSAPPPFAAPAEVQVHFWVIDAHAGAGGDDPALGSLSEPLMALRKSMGPLHFNLIEAVSGTTSGGGPARVSTGSGHIYDFDVNTANTNQQSIMMNVSYNDMNSQKTAGFIQVHTSIVPRSGQYIVLAQSPAATAVAPSATDSASPPTMRLLIVRADRMNPQS